MCVKNRRSAVADLEGFLHSFGQVAGHLGSGSAQLLESSGANEP